MLQSLRLEDFGGFQDTTLPLHPRVTVLVGRNGSGKSTVVHALRLVLSSVVRATGWFAVGDPDGPRFWLPGPLDVRSGAPGFRLSVEAGDRTLTWSFGAADAPDSWWTQADTLVSPHLAGFFPDRVVLCLGSTRGLPDARRPGIAGPSAKQVGRYLQDFAPDSEWRFHGLFTWVTREENLENEVRLRDDPAFRRPQLEAVRRALTTFLDQLGNARYENPRISRVDPRGEPWQDAADGRMVVDKDGQTLAIDQLSDGEQLTLLTVMDIARRLATASPGRSDPLAGSGLVVIDEIELHLHPGWQRGILPALLAAFPGLQFVVTTHSPQVVGSVDAESVRILEEFDVYAAPPTLGRDSNSLLEDVFRVDDRASEVADELRRVADRIDRGELEVARHELQLLADRLTETDPEVAHLREMLEFMAS